MERTFVEIKDFVNSDLWRLFPIINVDYVKDIPADYPGAMGVPITFMNKYNREQFEILSLARPIIGGHALYRRILIRNLHPDLPEVIDLEELLTKYGSEYEIAAIEEY